MTSPIGLWTPVWEHQVRHYCCRHLGLLELKVTIFGAEVEAVEERGVDLTEEPRTLSADSLTLKAAHL